LVLKGFAVEIDASGDKLDRKIRNAQLESFNFIGVVGTKEVEEKKITLRKRDEEKTESVLIAELIQTFDSLKPPKSKKRVELEAKTLKL
jgi:threonyl-tRNA synthetase